MAKKNKRHKAGIKKWLKAIILAILIALFVRTFIMQSFTVSTTKMGEAVFPGDCIMVNKLKYGARFPITLLSLPFFNNVYSEIIQLPYWRIPGFGKLKTGDLIIFNNPSKTDIPIDKKPAFIKRLIALPGDSLLINNKLVYINNLLIDTNFRLLYKYRIVTDGSKLSDELLNKYKAGDGSMIADMGVFDYCLYPEMADSLLNEPFVTNVRMIKDFPKENTHEYFPSSNYVQWNKDYFGPIKIPKQGNIVELHQRNIDIYKRIIEIYEDNELLISHNSITINGEIVESYKFKQDYFFVIDDSRDNGNDSRHWGFLPEDHIIGHASFIWKSSKKAKITKSNRFLKSI